MVWSVTGEETLGEFRTREELATSQSPSLGSPGHLRGRRTFDPVEGRDLVCPSAASCSHHSPTQREQAATAGKVLSFMRGGDDFGSLKSG